MTQQTATTTQKRKVLAGATAALLSGGLALGGVAAYYMYSLSGGEHTYIASELSVVGSGTGFDAPHVDQLYRPGDEFSSTYQVTNEGNYAVSTEMILTFGAGPEIEQYLDLKVTVDGAELPITSLEDTYVSSDIGMLEPGESHVVEVDISIDEAATGPLGDFDYQAHFWGE